MRPYWVPHVDFVVEKAVKHESHIAFGAFDGHAVSSDWYSQVEIQLEFLPPVGIPGGRVAIWS